MLQFLSGNKNGASKLLYFFCHRKLEYSGCYDKHQDISLSEPDFVGKYLEEFTSKKQQKDEGFTFSDAPEGIPISFDFTSFFIKTQIYLRNFGNKSNKSIKIIKNC